MHGGGRVMGVSLPRLCSGRGDECAASPGTLAKHENADLLGRAGEEDAPNRLRIVLVLRRAGAW
jgi:hypothetical protein